MPIRVESGGKHVLGHAVANDELAFGRLGGERGLQRELADLLGHAVRGVTRETCDLYVPDPMMCVLILCAHVMFHFIQPPLRHSIDNNIGELADIHELVQRADFDREGFRALVEQFDAGDCVRLTAYLLSTLYPSNPLAFLHSGEENGVAFPRMLSMHGIWTVLRSAEETLLPLDADTLEMRLGANAVLASSRKAVVYRVGGHGSGERIPRVLIHHRNGRRLSLQFTFAWDSRGLSFKLLLPLLERPEHAYQVSLHGRQEDYVFAAVTIREQGRSIETSWGESADPEITSTGYVLRLLLPWKILPETWRDSPTVFLLLCAMRWDRNPTPPLTQADVVVAAPLRIQRAE